MLENIESIKYKSMPTFEAIHSIVLLSTAKDDPIKVSHLVLCICRYPSDSVSTPSMGRSVSKIGRRKSLVATMLNIRSVKATSTKIAKNMAHPTTGLIMYTGPATIPRYSTRISQLKAEPKPLIDSTELLCSSDSILVATTYKQKQHIISRNAQ